jgi:hypothetical protein
MGPVHRLQEHSGRPERKRDDAARAERAPDFGSNVGNAALSRLIQRIPTDGRAHRRNVLEALKAADPGRRAVILRQVTAVPAEDPVRKKKTRRKEFTFSDLVKLGSQVPRLMESLVGTPKPLTEKERERLIQWINSNFHTAGSRFRAACQRHKDALRAAIRAEEELHDTISDVIVGLVMPFALSKLAATAARLYEREIITWQAFERTRHFADYGKDAFPGLVTAVMKGGVEGMKEAGHAEQTRVILFGESKEDDFLNALAETYENGLNRVYMELETQNDDVLLALLANYDPEVLTSDVLVRQIGELLGKFRRQVAPIHETETEGMAAGKADIQKHYETRAYWVNTGHGLNLAVLRRQTVSGSTTYQFVSWVSPEMGELAVKKSIEIRGGEEGIETVERSKIGGLP